MRSFPGCSWKNFLDPVKGRLEAVDDQETDEWGVEKGRVALCWVSDPSSPEGWQDSETPVDEWCWLKKNYY